MNTLQDTPRANRIHIGLFGKRNSGKSSLINALTGQEAALVSEVAGTTTDPVYKPMEIHGLGPCVFIDTAGLDDEGDLGALRIRQTLNREEYARGVMSSMLSSYFDGSLAQLVSFFSRHENIPAREMDEILEIMRNAKK